MRNLDNPTLIFHCPLNLHSQSVWNTNQDLTLRNPNLFDTKIAKHLQRLQVRAAAEDGADDEIIDRLAETDIDLLHLEIFLVFSEDLLESFQRDVAARMDVEMLEGGTGMGHDGFKTSGSKADSVRILAGFCGVNVAAFVEVKIDERGIEPTSEEFRKAVVGEG